MSPVSLEPAAPRSRVKHSTTEPQLGGNAQTARLSDISLRHLSEISHYQASY